MKNGWKETIKPPLIFSLPGPPWENRYSLLAARALTSLVWVVGYRQARLEIGLFLARDAEIMLSIAGRAGRIQATPKSDRETESLVNAGYIIFPPKLSSYTPG